LKSNDAFQSTNASVIHRKKKKSRKEEKAINLGIVQYILPDNTFMANTFFVCLTIHSFMTNFKEGLLLKDEDIADDFVPVGEGRGGYTLFICLKSLTDSS
jgi:hypothetical protein